MSRIVYCSMLALLAVGCSESHEPKVENVGVRAEVVEESATGITLLAVAENLGTVSVDYLSPALAISTTPAYLLDEAQDRWLPYNPCWGQPLPPLHAATLNPGKSISNRIVFGPSVWDDECEERSFSEGPWRVVVEFTYWTNGHSATKAHVFDYEPVPAP